MTGVQTCALPILVVTARLRAVAAQDTYDRVTVTICHRTGGHLQTEDFLFRDFNLDSFYCPKQERRNAWLTADAPDDVRDVASSEERIPVTSLLTMGLNLAIESWIDIWTGRRGPDPQRRKEKK